MSHSSSHARFLGAVYFLYFVTAVSGGVLVKGLTVHGDWAATAHNFEQHALAVRASSALDLISLVIYLLLTALFYELFRHVDRRLAMFAVLLSVAGCASQAVSDVFLGPVTSLAPAVGAAVGEDVSRLAESNLALHAKALSTALVLFGAFDLVLGILIVRSRFLPRALGVFMAAAGFGWLVYLWPPVSVTLLRVVQPFGFLAEVALMLWLLARGVNEDRWLALTGCEKTQG